MRVCVCICVCVCTRSSNSTFDSPTFGIACVTFSCVCIFPTEAARLGLAFHVANDWHATNVKNLLEVFLRGTRPTRGTANGTEGGGWNLPGMARHREREGLRNEELTFDETADDEMVETTN